MRVVHGPIECVLIAMDFLPVTSIDGDALGILERWWHIGGDENK
jgi:hypothetical protein